MKRSWDRTGFDSEQVLKDKFAEQDGVCAFCQQSLWKKQGAISHIIPRKLGGTSNMSNLRILCKKCNSTKQVSLRLPVTLWEDYENWKDTNESEVTFSEVVRMALDEFLPASSSQMQRRDEIEFLVRANSDLEDRLEDVNARAHEANMKLYSIWLELGGQPL